MTSKLALAALAALSLSAGSPPPGSGASGTAQAQPQDPQRVHNLRLTLDELLKPPSLEEALQFHPSPKPKEGRQLAQQGAESPPACRQVPPCRVESH